MFQKTPFVPIVLREEKEQEFLVRWANYHWFGRHLFAIPNGGLRDKRTAARLKVQGVKPGVSDLMLAIPSKGKHGLFIEMKRTKGGKLSIEQDAFLKDRESHGYEAKVAKGWKEASEIILGYLGEVL